ncbi:MAG: 50S ribosomal protein L11 methyltransferase [Clostridiales bacterium]|nr:50S ribosomal protein L11 methyltransferase [Clostridiales bacterium]
MDWIEVFVETTHEGIEIVSGLLYQSGLTGLMIEDENDFKEFLENPNRDWDYIEDELVEKKNVHPTGITFYLRDNLIDAEMLSSIKSALISLKNSEKEFDLGSLCITMKNVHEEDWANNWKKYFKPLPVGDKIIIRPSWEELAEPTDKIVLKIDPGHIFGTGTHETTQMCIEHIENYVTKGDSVLDIGCGSGILSIASLLLGASSAEAVDIDANAIQIAYENAAMNGISKDHYTVLAGNILEDSALNQRFQGKNYDVVEANIVADVIVALAPMVADYIKKDGIFITSGIIQDRLEDVWTALKENGFEILETKTKKDWAAVASRYIGK